VDTTLTDPLVGTVLEGRYRIDGVLARGGMSTVYYGTDHRLGRTVAIKVMAPTLADNPTFVDKFTREARSVAQLSHMNVVAVYDQGSDSGHAFLVMELVRGRTLRDLLDEGPLPPALAVTVMEAVLSALSAAHRAGLVHRDVKPENVLLSADGVVKVADFGLARAIAQASNTTQTGTVMGTVAYVAPEQVSRGSADARSDVYAAGIMLYELLTGAAPYRGDTAISVAYRHVHDDVPPPSAANPQVPPELDALVVRATRREPGARPVDAGAFLAELHDVRTDLGLPRVPVPPMGDGRPAGEDGASRSGQRATNALPGGGSNGAQPHVPMLRHGPTPPVYSEQTRYRRRHRAGLIVVLLLGVLAAAGGWWYGAGRYVTVPSLTGEARQEAVDTAHRDGLQVTFGSAVYHETAAPGTVAQTDPPGGHRIRRGGTLTILLSKGPAPRTIPTVANLSRDDALAALSSSGLSVKLAQAHDESVAAGNAVRTDPAAGSTLSRGGSVTLYISTGPAPRTIPNLAGRSADDATTTLSGLRLRVAGRSVQPSDTIGAGLVVGTDPPAGSSVGRDSAVTLVVSAGPDLVPVPNVYGMSVDAATRKLTAAGFKVAVQSLLGQPSGHVIAETPGPFSRAKPGSTITLGVL
jgi:serine/threonine-protein kinase